MEWLRQHIANLENWRLDSREIQILRGGGDCLLGERLCDRRLKLNLVTKMSSNYSNIVEFHYFFSLLLGKPFVQWSDKFQLKTSSNRLLRDKIPRGSPNHCIKIILIFQTELLALKKLHLCRADAAFIREKSNVSSRITCFIS